MSDCRKRRNFKSDHVPTVVAGNVGDGDVAVTVCAEVSDENGYGSASPEKFRRPSLSTDFWRIPSDKLSGSPASNFCARW